MSQASKITKCSRNQHDPLIDLRHFRKSLQWTQTRDQLGTSVPYISIPASISTTGARVAHACQPPLLVTAAANFPERQKQLAAVLTGLQPSPAAAVPASRVSDWETPRMG